MFAMANRNLSNGCVRVEDAKRLGRWLLGHEPVSPGTMPRRSVQLPQGMPIYLTYITAQVTDGKLTYLPDIYGWDRAAPPHSPRATRPHQPLMPDDRAGRQACSADAAAQKKTGPGVRPGRYFFA